MSQSLVPKRSAHSPSFKIRSRTWRRRFCPLCRHLVRCHSLLVLVRCLGSLGFLLQMQGLSLQRPRHHCHWDVERQCLPLGFLLQKQGLSLQRPCHHRKWDVEHQGLPLGFLLPCNNQHSSNTCKLRRNPGSRNKNASGSIRPSRCARDICL